MNLNQFPDKKRLACKGEALCALTYLFKDNGDSFVFVLSGNFAAGLDANAAAYESNLPSLAQSALPERCFLRRHEKVAAPARRSVAAADKSQSSAPAAAETIDGEGGDEGIIRRA